MADIFEATWNAGDQSEWDTTVNGNGGSAPTVSSTTKWKGAYSGQLQIANAAWSYVECRKTFTGVTTAYARAYFRVSALPASDETFYVSPALRGTDISANIIAGILIKNVGGVIKFYVGYNVGATETHTEITGITPAVDTWYYAEVGAYVHASAGWVKAWIERADAYTATEGSPNVNVTGIDTDYYGSVAGCTATAYSPEGIATIEYIDSYKVATSYIGFDRAGATVTDSLTITDRRVKNFWKKVTQALAVGSSIPAVQLGATVTDSIQFKDVHSVYLPYYVRSLSNVDSVADIGTVDDISNLKYSDSFAYATFTEALSGGQYKLQVEMKFADLPYSTLACPVLYLVSRLFSDDEKLSVQVWDGSEWVTLQAHSTNSATISASSSNWYFIKEYCTSSDLYIRIIDSNQISDAEQSTFELLCVELQDRGVFPIEVTCPTGHGTPDPDVGVHLVDWQTLYTIDIGTPDEGYEFDHFESVYTTNPYVDGYTVYHETALTTFKTYYYETRDYIFYYRPALPANKGYLVAYYDMTDHIWKELPDTHVNEIVEERRSMETATFTIANTEANRAFLHLDDPDDTESIYIKIFYGAVHDLDHTVFIGKITGGYLVKDWITVYCYNPALLKLGEAPSEIIHDFSESYVYSVLNGIKNYSGLSSVDLDFDYDDSDKLDLVISASFRGENAVEAIKKICELANVDFWGLASAPDLDYDAVLTFGERSTINVPTRFPEGSSHTFDRRKKVGQVVIKGKDATGTPIEGSAGTTGAVKTFVYTHPTDTVTLDLLAATKLELESNPTVAAPIKLFTEDAVFYRPGEYLTLNKPELSLVGTFVIQRLSKGEVITTCEVSVPIPREMAEVKEVSSLSKEQALSYVSA